MKILNESTKKTSSRYSGLRLPNIYFLVYKFVMNLSENKYRSINKSGAARISRKVTVTEREMKIQGE